MNTHKHTHTQALREIQAELPSRPQLPLVVKIKEIVDEALRVDDKAGDANIPITQLTFFGAEERVANAAEIARSVLRDLRPFNLEREEFMRRGAQLTWLRYPGVLENIVRIADALRAKSSDVDCVMSLNIEADMPVFDTLSRALRKVAPASLDELRNTGTKTQCKP
jgi:hypothetical protein